MLAMQSSHPIPNATQPAPTEKPCHICEEGLPTAVTTSVPMPSTRETATPTPLPDACQECRLNADRIYALSTMAARVRASAEPGMGAAIVRGFLFWMQGCPHCQEVLYGVLPELERRYGDELEIWLVELGTQEEVDSLFQVAAAFGVPKERVGVPLLILGDDVLTGSKQIPAEMPGLVERALKMGGLPLPENEVLSALLDSAHATPFTIEVTLPGGEAQPASMEHECPPSGYGLAVGVLIGMAVALLYGWAAVAQAYRGWKMPLPPAAWERAIPWLTVAGMAVAGYLAYVETQDVPAVCGPLGDCNAVQSSPYASFLGLIPVGWLGLIGYVSIFLAWLWIKSQRGLLKGWAGVTLFGLTNFGLLFSLYLTYLEPFVIRAVCLLCLTSSVIMTLLFLLSIETFLDALANEETQRASR